MMTEISRLSVFLGRNVFYLNDIGFSGVVWLVVFVVQECNSRAIEFQERTTGRSNRGQLPASILNMIVPNLKELYFYF